MLFCRPPLTLSPIISGPNCTRFTQQQGEQRKTRPGINIEIYEIIFRQYAGSSISLLDYSTGLK